MVCPLARATRRSLILELVYLLTLPVFLLLLIPKLVNSSRISDRNRNLDIAHGPCKPMHTPVDGEIVPYEAGEEDATHYDHGCVFRLDRKR